MLIHKNLQAASRSESANNAYPLWLALLVAVVILLVTAGIASTFPTYGSGKSSFDSHGLKNFATQLKVLLTWFIGICAAIASVLAGLMESLQSWLAKRNSPPPVE